MQRVKKQEIIINSRVNQVGVVSVDWESTGCDLATNPASRDASQRKLDVLSCKVRAAPGELLSGPSRVLTARDASLRKG